MGEAKTKYSFETIRHDMAQDIVDEANFLRELGEEKPEGLITDLEVLVNVYNEQVTALTHFRADLETFTALEALEPWNDVWKGKKEETVRIMKSRRVTLQTVREQLRVFIKGGGEVVAKGKGKPKKEAKKAKKKK